MSAKEPDNYVYASKIKDITIRPVSNKRHRALSQSALELAKEQMNKAAGNNNLTMKTSFARVQN